MSRCFTDSVIAAAAHPEVRLIHSGSHRFFAALHEEVAQQDDDFLPSCSGEMNFCLRGCYASAARVKFTYCHLEALASRAETASSLVRAAVEKTPHLERHAAQLQDVWEDVLTSSFHDILPGSSVEHALGEQTEWMDGGLHVARCAEFEALNALAQHSESSVPEVPYDKPSAVPFLLWNPQPQLFVGWVELETCLGDRPLFDYANRAHQVPIEVRLPDGTRALFQMLALAPRENGLRLRALSHENVEIAELTLLDRTLILGALRLGEIATYDLQPVDRNRAGQHVVS